MLGPPPPVRYHIFLLVTETGESAKVASAKIAYITMSARPQVFIVAVVDDDESILQSLEYLLESADYAVRTFASAGALLESGDLPQIDCLISDVDMPGIDGFELVRLVHAARAGLPVILITGYPALKGLPPLGRTNPRVFTKPFQGHELLAAVSEALRNASG